MLKLSTCSCVEGCILIKKYELNATGPNPTRTPFHKDSVGDDEIYTKPARPSLTSTVMPARRLVRAEITLQKGKLKGNRNRVSHTRDLNQVRHPAGCVHKHWVQDHFEVTVPWHKQQGLRRDGNKRRARLEQRRQWHSRPDKRPRWRLHRARPRVSADRF